MIARHDCPFRLRRPVAATIVLCLVRRSLSMPTVGAMVHRPRGAAGCSTADRVDARGRRRRGQVCEGRCGPPEPACSSEPTTSTDGTFLIDGAPAGSYALLVETGEGAFLSSDPLELQPGVNKPLALNLNSGAQQTGIGSAKPMKPWKKWSIIGVLSATALYIGSRVTDSDSSERVATPTVLF